MSWLAELGAGVGGAFAGVVATAACAAARTTDQAPADGGAPFLASVDTGPPEPRLTLRFARDRRSPVGDRLGELLLCSETVTFDGLLEGLADADVREVAEWLGHALDRGMVDEHAPLEGGPRRFVLRPQGAQMLLRGRRSGDLAG